MSNQHDDGGPAFPLACKPIAGETVEWGMSLRDWFAGQALAGLNAKTGGEITSMTAARYAYDDADAMIAERNRRNDDAN